MLPGLQVAGQVPVEPSTGVIVGQTAGEQTRQALRGQISRSPHAGLSVGGAPRVPEGQPSVTWGRSVRRRRRTAPAEPLPRRSSAEPPSRCRRSRRSLGAGAEWALSVGGVVRFGDRGARWRGSGLVGRAALRRPGEVESWLLRCKAAGARVQGLVPAPLVLGEIGALSVGPRRAEWCRRRPPSGGRDGGAERPRASVLGRLGVRVAGGRRLAGTGWSGR